MQEEEKRVKEDMRYKDPDWVSQSMIRTLREV